MQKSFIFACSRRMQSLVKREVICPEMCATTKMANLAKIRQRFVANSKMCKRAPWKVAILTKMANMTITTNLAKIRWRLSKNSNEMSKEAPWKVAIFTNMGKMAIVPKICQRLSENSMRCLQGPFISGDFDENGKCRENLAESRH